MHLPPPRSFWRSKPFAVLAAAVLLIALVAVGVNVWIGTQLRARLLAVAEPGSSIGRVGWSFSGVTLRDVHLKAPRGWPQAEILTARKIVIIPAWTTLLGEHPRIHEIRLSEAGLSVRRTQQRKLEFLPGMTGGPKPNAKNRQVSRLTIDEISVVDGSLNLYDAAVADTAQQLQLSEVDLHLGHLQLPVSDERTDMHLRALVPGKPTGRVEITGWTNFGVRQSMLQTTLSAVDLRTVEPYLLKSQPSGFEAGTLDLKLNSRTENGEMVAPGRIVLTGVKLASKGLSETLLNLPRAAVLSALEDDKERIELDFTLHSEQGRKAEIDVNEPLGKKLAFVLAEGLGLTLGGVAEGIGEVGQTGVKAVGSVFGFVLSGGGLLSGDDKK